MCVCKHVTTRAKNVHNHCPLWDNHEGGHCCQGHHKSHQLSLTNVNAVAARAQMRGRSSMTAIKHFKWTKTGYGYFREIKVMFPSLVKGSNTEENSCATDMLIFSKLEKKLPLKEGLYFVRLLVLSPASKRPINEMVLSCRGFRCECSSVCISLIFNSEEQSLLLLCKKKAT